MFFFVWIIDIFLDIFLGMDNILFWVKYFDENYRFVIKNEMEFLYNNLVSEFDLYVVS